MQKQQPLDISQQSPVPVTDDDASVDSVTVAVAVPPETSCSSTCIPRAATAEELALAVLDAAPSAPGSSSQQLAWDLLASSLNSPPRAEHAPDTVAGALTANHLNSPPRGTARR
eukprot:scpid33459/ scgid2782/ 